MTENPLDPSPETEARIRDRAYFLWEQDGRPHGQHDEYWERARELQGMADSIHAGERPVTDRVPHAADGTPIEEASIQQNLGEFPHAGSSDQGDRQETPLPRKPKAAPKPSDAAPQGQDQAQPAKSGTSRKKTGA